MFAAKPRDPGDHRSGIYFHAAGKRPGLFRHLRHWSASSVGRGRPPQGNWRQVDITVDPINGVTPVPSSQPVFDTVNFKAPFDAGGDVPQNTYSLVVSHGLQYE